MAAREELLIGNTAISSADSSTSNGSVEAPVTFLKTMTLDEGYVPEQEVRRSVEEWQGIPVTDGHPKGPDGHNISVKYAQDIVIGEIVDPEIRSENGDTYVDATVRLDKSEAITTSRQATKLVERVSNGETVQVSSGYYGNRMDSGVYDGEYHENVVGNLRANHVALLPSSDFPRCTIQDGCGIAVNFATNTTMSNNTFVSKKDLRESLISNNSTPYSASDMNELLLMNREDLVEAADESDMDISHCINSVDAFENRASKRIENEQSSDSDEDEDLSGWENRASYREDI
jgi:hypothetical protein